jgi:hypothetical protein
VGIYVNPGKDNFEVAVRSQIYLDIASFLVRAWDIANVMDSIQLSVIEELRGLYPDAANTAWILTKQNSGMMDILSLI